LSIERPVVVVVAVVVVPFRRYKRVTTATKNFDLFTLQSALPVVDMKAKVGKCSHMAPGIRRK
jgi:hypothetical protein